MRPHGDDNVHNIRVGRAFREVVHDAIVHEGLGPTAVDERVGRQVNIIAQHSYDLGRREAVQPHMN